MGKKCSVITSKWATWEDTCYSVNSVSNVFNQWSVFSQPSFSLSSLHSTSHRELNKTDNILLCQVWVLAGSKQCPSVPFQLTFMYISPIHASMHWKYFKSQCLALAGTPFCFTCFDLCSIYLTFLDLPHLIWPPGPHYPPPAMPSCVRHTTPVSQVAMAVWQTNSNYNSHHFYFKYLRVGHSEVSLVYWV